MSTQMNKNFEVTMSLEHLGESVQQHLRAFGYFTNEDQHFSLRKLSVNQDGTVTLKGNLDHE